MVKRVATRQKKRCFIEVPKVVVRQVRGAQCNGKTRLEYDEGCSDQFSVSLAYGLPGNQGALLQA